MEVNIALLRFILYCNLRSRVAAAWSSRERNDKLTDKAGK